MCTATETRTEMEAQSIAWLKRLGITEPCGLDKLNGVELRDLARQIQQAVSSEGSRAFKAAMGR